MSWISFVISLSHETAPVVEMIYQRTHTEWNLVLITVELWELYTFPYLTAARPRMSRRLDPVVSSAPVGGGGRSGQRGHGQRVCVETVRPCGVSVEVRVFGLWALQVRTGLSWIL